MKRHLIAVASLLLCATLSAAGANEPTHIKSPKSNNATNTPDLRSVKAYSSQELEWHQFGPGMSGNNKKAFWHPTDPNYLYIAPNMGNSYVSTDKGQSYLASADNDAPGCRGLGRGPRGLSSIDFSYQDDTYGFATDSETNGIYFTSDKGLSWELRQEPQFVGKTLSWVEVDPTDDKYWYVGGGLLSDKVKMTFPLSTPHGKIFKSNDKIWSASRGNMWRSSDRGETWELINKGLPEKGDVGQVIVDPNNPKTLYTNTTYGFYKSSDRGESWRRITNGLETDVVRWMTMHYDKQSKRVTLYAICNVEWIPAGKSVETGRGGVFRSDDCGESWRKINGSGNGTIGLDLTKLSSKGAGLVRSQYRTALANYFGKSTKQIDQLYPELPTMFIQQLSSIEVDPTDVNNIYVTNDYSKTSIVNVIPGALLRSCDGGESWHIAYRDGYMWGEAYKDSPDHDYWRSRAEQPINNNAFFKYRRNEMERYPYSRKSCNFIKLNCDATAAHVQLGAIGLMSSNKGETWEDIDDRYILDETTDPATNTSNSYVGAGNSNLPGHGFYQHPALPGEVYCCSGENNLWKTCEGADEVRKGGLGVTQTQFIVGTSMSSSAFAIDPHDTNIRYALLFRQHEQGKLMRSIDAGKTWGVYGTALPDWSEAVAGLTGDRSVHQISLIIDPNDTKNLYFCVPWKANDLEYVGESMGHFGVHKSSDGGLTWSSCNKGLPVSKVGGKSNAESAPSVASVVFDPKSTSTLYAAVQCGDGGLYRSMDRGDTWEVVSSAKSLIKGAEVGVNDIHFDKDGYAYITVGSSRADKGDMSCGLWVSRDGMKSWRKIFDYPHLGRVETAIYDPKIIIVAALANPSIQHYNAGVYLSRDGGKSWIKVNGGNAQSDRTNDIAIDYTKRGRYYVSSYGSGWYYLDDPQVK